jgi:hypothetical protein
VVQHADIAANACSLADDNAFGVVAHDAGTKNGARVDVDVQLAGDTAVDGSGEVCASLSLETVCNAMGLEGLEALEEEKRLGGRLAGGVALVYSPEIVASSALERGVAGVHVEYELEQLGGHEGAVAQLVR